jgi:drug/metabolite transporter (DMT)-like permease
MSFLSVLAGNVCYLASEIIAKLYLSDCTVVEVSLARFAIGAPLFLFAAWRSFDARTIYFALVNVLNSVVGTGAILYGTLQSFAIASQMRPVFVAASAVLLYRETVSLRTVLVLAGCCAVSAAIVYSGPDLFSGWTYIFLGTIALQALSFAMVGQPGSANVWSILALYNVVGLLACGIAGSLVFGISLARLGNHALPLAGSAAFGFLGSILVLIGISERDKARNGIASYVRLPLTIMAGVLLFAEPISITTLIFLGILVALLSIGGLQRCRLRIDSGVSERS